jgi:hypothetical protein
MPSGRFLFHRIYLREKEDGLYPQLYSFKFTERHPLSYILTPNASLNPGILYRFSSLLLQKFADVSSIKNDSVFLSGL